MVMAVTPLIRYALEDDVPGLCKVNALSFQNRRFHYAMFPEADLPTLQEYMAFGSLKHLADLQMHVLAVDDLATKEIIAYARWRIPDALGFHQSVCDLSEKGAESAAIAASNPFFHAPRPCNEAVFTAFKKMMNEARKKHTTERDMILDLLATLPSHQGHGVGSALLKWGMEKADAWQTRIYLEATPEGLPVYLKYGWKPVEEIMLDLAALGDVGQEDFVVMMRDPFPL